MAEQSMRERVADGARKYLTRCANLGTSIDYADLADAVLAEIETPTEGMIQSACDATFGATPLTPEKAHRIGYVAAIRAAREGR